MKVRITNRGGICNNHLYPLEEIRKALRKYLADPKSDRNVYWDFDKTKVVGRVISQELIEGRDSVSYDVELEDVAVTPMFITTEESTLSFDKVLMVFLAHNPCDIVEMNSIE